MKITVYEAMRGNFTLIVNSDNDSEHFELEFDELVKALLAYKLYSQTQGYLVDLRDNTTEKWYIVDMWI